MKPEILIVRYGEIGLKKKITRRFFENTLIKNIKYALQQENIDFEIEQKRARIYLYLKQINNCSNIFTKIFGITSFSPAYKTISNKESLKKLALKISENKISKNTSFALKVNRLGNHDFSSQDIAVFLGDAIKKKTNAPVNLSNPDITLFVEIMENESFLFFEKIHGPGGLPVGTQGRVLSYINSKEDILASWYIIRRGCTPIFLIKEKVFSNIIEEFNKNWYCNCYIEKNKILDFDKYSKQKKCDAIVTGLNVQDINKIKDLKNQIKTPVLHPLIGLSQEEVNRKLKEIGL